MKSIFIAMVVMFIFVGCDFQTADHIVTDSNGNEKIADGYEGGACLPGGVCSKGLECSEKVCVVKEDETSDKEEETSDEDTNVVEQNDCFGMVATYNVVPYKVVTFGTKNYQSDIFPESKVVVAGDNACSMIAYTHSGTIIEPVKCEGVHQTAPGEYEACVYNGALDLVDSSKGCDWLCTDYK
jgi:uncharacterized lipoprotein NlpE involved in copper resistance